LVDAESTRCERCPREHERGEKRRPRGHESPQSAAAARDAVTAQSTGSKRATPWNPAGQEVGGHHRTRGTSRQDDNCTAPITVSYCRITAVYGSPQEAFELYASWRDEEAATIHRFQQMSKDWLEKRLDRIERLNAEKRRAAG
jgi:hypothetical protein